MIHLNKISKNPNKQVLIVIIRQILFMVIQQFQIRVIQLLIIILLQFQMRIMVILVRILIIIQQIRMSIIQQIQISIIIQRIQMSTIQVIKQFLKKVNILKKINYFTFNYIFIYEKFNLNIYMNFFFHFYVKLRKILILTRLSFRTILLLHRLRN